MFDPSEILKTLNRHRVAYVLIGDVAATLHGCPEQTYDLDILYADNATNRRRLLAALRELDARWDRPLTDEVLQRQPVFALNTKRGDLDIFSEVLGIGTYEQAVSHRLWVKVGRSKVPMLDLLALIKSKEAAADPNPRKRAALAYLKVLLRRG